MEYIQYSASSRQEISRVGARFRRPHADQAKIQAMDAFTGLPLVFVPNHGQAHPKVSFYGENSTYKVFFTPEEVVLVFAETSPVGGINAPSHSIIGDCDREIGLCVEGFALYLKFTGASPTIPEGQLESQGTVNYFIGDDSGKWCTGLHTYREIAYRNLWPNIDLVFRELGGELKYEFVAHPGADIGDIGIAYSGVDELVLDESGNILIKTPFGILTDKKPVSYQVIGSNKAPIASNFVIAKSQDGANLCRFVIDDNYSPDHILVIDPGLSFPPPYPKKRRSLDMGTAIAVDNNANAYVTGLTVSIDFPVTPGAFQATLKGSENAFITVINAYASGAASLLYSTYLGGSGVDRGLGIEVDNSGNAYVTGLTESTDFPVTTGAFQSALKGHGNAFIAVINTYASGAAALVYSSYLGGSNFDAGFGIAIDNSGNAYITGLTQSPDFPYTPAAFQTVLRGPKDAFISVVNTGASGAASLSYSTYLGGSSSDEGYGIAVDSSGNTYVTGYTHSTDFPVTGTAFQAVLNSVDGGANAFLSKINTAASGLASLVYSTYLGGSRYDQGCGVAVDAAGNAYLTGFTKSSDFPVTSGAVQGILKNIYGGANAFISKINTLASGSRSLAYSTYLGGTSYDEGHGIVIDTAGNAYVTGYTYSSDFPVTPNAFQPMLKSIYDGSNAFLSRINTNASGSSSFVYSTYLGGEYIDAGNGVALDRFGNTYMTGRTQSCNFPVTPGAFQSKLRGEMNAFVSLIDTNHCDVASFAYSSFLGGSCANAIDP